MLSFYLTRARHLALSANSFSHQWFTLSHLCHIPPFGPSLPHQKPPGLAGRAPPTPPPPTQRPAEDIIYASHYDADSSINKGLSLRLFQPSQALFITIFHMC